MNRFSNIGKLGGTYSSPIITYPQVHSLSMIDECRSVLVILEK